MATQPDSHQGAHVDGSSEAELRVSAYDRVASMLIALLLVIGLFVVLLFIVWLTGRLMFTNVARRVEWLPDAGRDDHAAGFAQGMEEPGMEDMQELNEPRIEAMLDAIADVVTSQAAAFDGIENRATAAVDGGRLGDRRLPGPPDDGIPGVIPAWQRWEMRFSTTGVQAYARQLDFFKIELGAAGGGPPKVDYARNFAKSKPDRRLGKPEDEKRLYMTWQDGSAMAEFDRQLIAQAGITTQRRLILQFYPKEIEKLLARLEAQVARRAGHTDPRAFLKTIFGVRPARDGYEFYVIEQSFRPAPKS